MTQGSTFSVGFRASIVPLLGYLKYFSTLGNKAFFLLPILLPQLERMQKALSDLKLGDSDMPKCFPVPEQALPELMWSVGDCQSTLFWAGQTLCILLFFSCCFLSSSYLFCFLITPVLGGCFLL